MEEYSFESIKNDINTYSLDQIYAEISKYSADERCSLLRKMANYISINKLKKINDIFIARDKNKQVRETAKKINDRYEQMENIRNTIRYALRNTGCTFNIQNIPTSATIDVSIKIPANYNIKNTDHYSLKMKYCIDDNINDILYATQRTYTMMCECKLLNDYNNAIAKIDMAINRYREHESEFNSIIKSGAHIVPLNPDESVQTAEIGIDEERSKNKKKIRRGLDR